MTKRFKRGQAVAWKWGEHTARGEVQHISRSHTEIESRGQTISRHGSENNPAITIKQPDGTKVLKLASELQIDS